MKRRVHVTILAFAAACAVLSAGAAQKPRFPRAFADVGITLLDEWAADLDLSADGKRLVYTRRDPRDWYFDLWVARPSGRAQECLGCELAEPSKHRGGASWHPSGEDPGDLCREPGCAHPPGRPPRGARHLAEHQPVGGGGRRLEGMAAHRLRDELQGAARRTFPHLLSRRSPDCLDGAGGPVGRRPWVGVGPVGNLPGRLRRRCRYPVDPQHSPGAAGRPARVLPGDRLVGGRRAAPRDGEPAAGAGCRRPRHLPVRPGERHLPPPDADARLGLPRPLLGRRAADSTGPRRGNSACGSGRWRGSTGGATSRRTCG